MAKAKQKWYAVKSIDGEIVNKIYTTWDECEKAVLHHCAVYKSFPTEDQAKDYFKAMTKEKTEDHVKKMEYSKEKKKTIKSTTMPVHLRVPNELYKKFQFKLKQMKYDESQIIIDLIKDWCDYDG